MNSPRFLIDSDVLITAKNRYYAFPICPGFWQSILHGHPKRVISSIDRVKQELLNGSPDDDLVKWVDSSVPNSFFHSCGDQRVVEAFGEIMLWVQRHSSYTDAAKAKFASGADGWLVAYCKVHRHTVVTNEQRAPDSRKHAKLPDVCDAFGVETDDTFEMLERVGAEFHFKT